MAAARCRRYGIEYVEDPGSGLRLLRFLGRRVRGFPVPWNPSSKTPLPKRAGSSINRSNARSFATGYRAVSLLPSLPRNLVSTKASSSLGRRPAVEDLQSQLDAARREIRHLHEQRDILKKRWAFSPNRPGTLRTGSRDEIRPFHRDALQQPRGFAQRAL